MLGAHNDSPVEHSHAAHTRFFVTVIPAKVGMTQCGMLG